MDLRTDQFSAVEHLYGQNDVEAMFPEGALIRPVPWQGASRRKNQAPFDKDLVRHTLQTPIEGTRGLTDIDPRVLRASQPNVTRAGVAYYMSPQFEQTGRTFADQSHLGNQHPLVYSREGQEVLLSGHHRAAAALLKGQPLRARRISGPWGEQR